MGSERFKGVNAAHDTSKSSKGTQGGWEGIFANISLSSLMMSVDAAAKARRSKRRGAKPDRSACDFLLTKLMMGSLWGKALTAMVTCVSLSQRNGAETYLSLQYGSGMAKLLNAGAPQPAAVFDAALKAVRKGHASSTAIIARGVHGKYQARREAEVVQYAQDVRMLEELVGGGGMHMGCGTDS